MVTNMYEALEATDKVILTRKRPRIQLIRKLKCKLHLIASMSLGHKPRGKSGSGKPPGKDNAMKAGFERR